MQPFDPDHLPPQYHKYAHAERIYGCICAALSGRSDLVDWSVFAPQDWVTLAEIAQEESVAPLLYWQFKTTAWPEGIPTQTAAHLMQHYFRCQVSNQALYQALDVFLLEIQSAAIPVVLLKGINFAKTLYPDIGLRPMLDMDLLVRWQDADQVMKILSARGYQRDFRADPPGFLHAIEHHYHMVNDQGIQVELHWNLIAGSKDWRTPSEDWLWRNVEPVEFAGKKAPHLQCLSPAAALLYCCAHIGLQHGLEQARLIWFYDVHALIIKYGPTLDWDALAAQAYLLNWGAALRTVLANTQARFGTPIPESVMDQLGAQKFTDEYLVQRKSSFSSYYDQLDVLFASLEPAARTRFILGRLFPSPGFIRHHHHPKPAWLWPFFYPYRWGMITFNVIKMFLLRLRKIRLEK
jgi:hypothetical protein